MLLEPGTLTLEQLHRMRAGGEALELNQSSRRRIARAAAVVQAAAKGSAAVYGVNTGFGKLANQRISTEQLDQLQLNLIRSHCAGVGAPP